MVGLLFAALVVAAAIAPIHLQALAKLAGLLKPSEELVVVH